MTELEARVEQLEQEQAVTDAAIGALAKLVLHQMGAIKLKPEPETLAEFRELAEFAGLI
ncbi:MAG: hypothetical protein IJ520_11330 [Synergistaceae bacterium]|nr:hypothetical protein [Synergistaceae bacterium]